MSDHSETVRLPPQNIPAEASLLRAMLLDNQAVDDALAEMSVDDLYSPAHRIVFDVMLGLIRAGKPATALTVAEELERIGKLNDVGGWERLFDLLNSLPSEVAHVRYHARIVREHAQRRRIILAADELRDAAYGHTDTNDLLAMWNRAEQDISAREQARGCLTMHDVLLKRRDALQQETRPHVPTGWPDLDEKLSGGMRAGSLVVVGARPSVGKSAWALSAFLAGAQVGCPGMFVSLEQSQIEIANRLLAIQSRLPFADIEADLLTDSLDCDRLADAEDELARLPMKVIDDSSSRLSQIVASARSERRNGLRLVILDYLQLIHADDDRLPREQQVASLSRGLKRLARDLDCVVVCLAQLNRGIEGRDRKQPRLSDLRESGSIEQDADVVLFLDRPATYDPDAAPTEANIIIAKNRNGPCGKVPLLWHGPTMTYRSPARPWEAAASASHWFPPPTSKATNQAT